MWLISDYFNLIEGLYRILDVIVITIKYIYANSNWLFSIHKLIKVFEYLSVCIIWNILKFLILIKYFHQNFYSLQYFKVQRLYTIRTFTQKKIEEPFHLQLFRNLITIIGILLNIYE